MRDWVHDGHEVLHIYSELPIARGYNYMFTYVIG